jgi:anti-sigma factor (TIGR02949 family)
MTVAWCQRLEDFFDRSLSVPEQQHFRAHLAHCPVCQQAVAEQERLRQLLRRAVAQEPVPAGLEMRVRARLRQARRQHLLGRIAGLAAAVLLLGVLVGWPIRPSPPMERIDKTPIAQTKPQEISVQERVIIRTSSDMLAVKLPTQSPHVTIVWVYPRAGMSPTVPPALPLDSERNQP